MKNTLLNPVEVNAILKSFSVIVDTREHRTERAIRRYESFGTAWEFRALSYGDYRGKVVMPDGSELLSKCVVERKESLTEAAGNFTKGRDRFIREFERAKDDNARMFLLIEDATWENLINGKYRSRFHPSAFTASVIAFMVRYEMGLVFCKEETSGKLIKEICFRDIKEQLERGVYDHRGDKIEISPAGSDAE